jgi:2-haloacid dehalogenase
MSDAMIGRRRFLASAAGAAVAAALPGLAIADSRQPRILLLDVMDTMLDLRPLRAHFERMFGDPNVAQLWFGQMLQSAFVLSLTGSYADLGRIGSAALDMVAQRRGVSISPEDRQALFAQVRSLPAHPDVPDGLRRLKDAGFRLATLSNSTQALAEAQMRHARLDGYFEKILTADLVQRFKPAPEPYRYAAQAFAAAPGEVCLIAAHAWDIAGALRAGCAAAFVARPGQVLDPLAPAPDISGKDLIDVADALIARAR